MKYPSALLASLVLLVLALLPLGAYAAPVDLAVHGHTLHLEWDDGWFGRPSTEYNHDMARLAAYLSCEAYEQDANKDAMPDCYRALGVADSDLYLGYDVDYNDAVWGNDQCAFSIAIKTLASGKKVVFVVVRGTPANMNEWLSNLNLNDNGKTEREMHEGFAKAARQVELAMAAFMVEHLVDFHDAYLLLTGHSRGAAVANIVAADIAQAKFFPTDHVYAYTFAAPNVTTAQDAASSTYDYIWNIVGGEDVVPAVPFNRGNWQYRKWGHTLVIVSYWNIDGALFTDDRLPRMNELFRQLVGRDYCPWYLGAFLPVQVVSSFADRNRDVSDFYKKSRSTLARLIDKVLLSPAIMGTAEETEAEGKRNMIKRVLDMINRRTDGFVDYAFKALNDMHASEGYLSWMMTMSEDELFSTLGYSQIVITGRAEGAVLDDSGQVLARIIEGRVKLASIKRPVGAFTLGKSSVAVGVPGNMTLRFVMTNESLISTPMKVAVEHYAADSTLLTRDDDDRVYPHRCMVYEWPIGAPLNDGGLFITKRYGSEARKIIKDATLKASQMFYVAPEIAFDTDRNLELGLRAGSQAIYTTLLADIPIARYHDRFDLCGGVGTQCTLVGPVVLDMTAVAKMSFVYAGDGKLFNFVPEMRFALETHPLRRVALFVGGAFDFHIAGVNDAAFDDEANAKLMGEINMGDNLGIAPRVLLGVRF